ncbi:MAG: hypothetical protein KIT58_00915 [Planctomycetota bacterium]|nr:hypothetical protein [Planctomycetota bacterium]
MSERVSGVLCIVPCGKAKIWDRQPSLGPVEARRVYIGTFAGAARRYAEKFYESWVILSAKHGFLLPSDLVPGPYEVTFKRRRDPALVKIATLRDQVASKSLDSFDDVVVVAGRDYVKPVRDAFGHRPPRSFITPLIGYTSMGEMISVLTQAVAEGRPLAPRAPGPPS